jgi:hypothetical protein
MENIKAILSILSIILLSSSFFFITSTYAQLISKPSIPDFTIKYVDHSYNTATTYKTDPYNGQQVVDQYSQYVENRTIEITIRNQPFTPYNDSDGHEVNLFFDVRHKGSYAEDWVNMFGGMTQSIWYDFQSPYAKYGYAVEDYSSQTTTVLYQLVGAPLNGRVDIEVQALEGYTIASYDGHIMFSVVSYSFIGQESGWSNSQTVTFGNAPSPLPTYVPQQTATPQPTSNSPVSTTNPPTMTPQSTPVVGNDLQGLSLERIIIVVLAVTVAALAVIVVLQRNRRK